MRRTRVATLCFTLLLTFALLAVFAPWVAPYHYAEQSIDIRLQLPSIQHWMGTDSLGRDLLSRIIYGARMSLAVGMLTALFSLIAGTLTGIAAGYFGGWLDLFLMRVVDLFYIFPSILLAILLMLFFGRGFTGIFLSIGVVSWVTQARLVRGQVLQAKEMEYVESARAIGVSSFAILYRHILPNLWGPILVSLTFQIPTNIMAESFLSFIGLGLQPPFSSWGTLANEGFRAMKSYPHLILFPGIMLFVAMLAFNFLGDAISDSLDPKHRKN